MVQGYILNFIKREKSSPVKGGSFNAENISAQEAPQKKGAWIQKENVYCKRPQGSCKKKSKG